MAFITLGDDFQRGYKVFINDDSNHQHGVNTEDEMNDDAA